MFIKITNGNSFFEVPKSAFENTFKKQGYRIVDEKEVLEKAEESEEVVTTEVVVKEQKKEKKEKTSPESAELTDDQKFINKMKERPVSEWNKAEIKKVAKIAGIDISGTASADEARAIIAKELF